MSRTGASRPARAFEDAVYDQFARITKALASPVCFEIVDVLAQGERSVDALILLEAHGRRGVRLVEGLPDWRAAGYGVAVVPDRA